MLNFIEVNSELCAGTRGASLGPAAIRTAGFNKNNPLLSKYPYRIVPTENHLLYTPVTTPFAKYITALTRIYNRTCEEVYKVIKEGSFPLVLAGDHSTAGATIAGIKKAFPDKRLGVVWIDAHADLHSPYTTPSGNLHGMPLATALAIDNPECKINNIVNETKEGWEALKNTGGICPKIDAADLVFISVRSTEPAEEHLINTLKIKNFTTDKVRQFGPEQIAKNTLNYLNRVDYLYISFDVDSLDHSVSLGTGTPAEHGLMVNEAHSLINYLVNNDKTVCFEIVEVNPCLDNKCNTMAETAFDIINDVATIISKKK